MRAQVTWPSLESLLNPKMRDFFTILDQDRNGSWIYGFRICAAFHEYLGNKNVPFGQRSFILTKFYVSQFKRFHGRFQRFFANTEGRRLCPSLDSR
jgi:hypothetical protein